MQLASPLEDLDVAALTQLDKCDRCPAQARVRVRMPSYKILDFCRHHYNEHEPALIAQYAQVVREYTEGL